MPILVVDDDESHLYALGHILDRAGFKVLRAGTLAAASALAHGEHPRLILLDINLPDGDGFDLFKQLRSTPATSDIPVVFHSAISPTQYARQRVITLGAEGFLTYPIDATDLIAVVMVTAATTNPSKELE